MTIRKHILSCSLKRSNEIKAYDTKMKCGPTTRHYNEGAFPNSNQRHSR